MNARSNGGCQADSQIARLLACRYGDGTVYLPSGAPRDLIKTSIALGYLSRDGFITREGRLFLAHNCER